MPGTVVIIGRTNVGKSTLFNRLSETRKAMVSNIPGTTRDLKYAAAKWQGKEFELVDTGGFLAEEKSEIKQLTRKESKETIFWLELTKEANTDNPVNKLIDECSQLRNILSAIIKKVETK